MSKLANLKVKLFTDGADKAQIVEMAKQPWIKGFVPPVIFNGQPWTTVTTTAAAPKSTTPLTARKP